MLRRLRTDLAIEIEKQHSCHKARAHHEVHQGANGFRIPVGLCSRSIKNRSQKYNHGSVVVTGEMKCNLLDQAVYNDVCTLHKAAKQFGSRYITPRSQRNGRKWYFLVSFPEPYIIINTNILHMSALSPPPPPPITHFMKMVLRQVFGKMKFEMVVVEVKCVVYCNEKICMSAIEDLHHIARRPVLPRRWGQRLHQQLSAHHQLAWSEFCLWSSSNILHNEVANMQHTSSPASSVGRAWDS